MEHCIISSSSRPLKIEVYSEVIFPQIPVLFAFVSVIQQTISKRKNMGGKAIPTNSSTVDQISRNNLKTVILSQIKELIKYLKKLVLNTYLYKALTFKHLLLYKIFFYVTSFKIQLVRTLKIRKKKYSIFTEEIPLDIWS